MLSKRAIDFSHFRLTDTIGKLHLSVRSLAVFHLPTVFDQLSDEKVIQSMLHGECFVTRGPHCRLVVILYHEGKVIEENHWQSLYEAVEEALRKAPLWKQLGLNVTIDREQPLTRNSKRYIIRIQVDYDQLANPGGDGMYNPRQTSVDITAPECVPHVFFEGLRLECNLMDLEWEHKNWKVLPTFRPKLSEDPTSLLDSPSTLLLTPHTPSTEGAHLAIDDEPKQPGLQQCIKRSVVLEDGQVDNVPITPTPKRRRQAKRISAKPPGVVNKQAIVRNWVRAHPHHTFTTASDKARLVKETGYTSAYVGQLLARFKAELEPLGSASPMRHGIEAPGNETVQQINNHSDLFQITSPQGVLHYDAVDAHRNLQDDNVDVHRDLHNEAEEILLSTHDGSMRHVSTHTLPLSQYLPHETTHLLQPTQNKDAEVVNLDLIQSISIISSSTLLESAVRLAIGGKQRIMPAGVRIRSGAMRHSLSMVCPSLFEPGFRKLASRNSIFAGRIAYDVARWANIVQSPGLTTKLERLNTLYSSNVDTPDNTDIEIHGQRSLWTMLHRYAHNPKATASLKCSSRSSQSLATDRTRHGIGTLPTPASSQVAQQSIGNHVRLIPWQQSNAHVEIGEDDLDDDSSEPAHDFEGLLQGESDFEDLFQEESDFEDLLDQDLNFRKPISLGSLASLAELERMSIEQETDLLLLYELSDDSNGDDDSMVFAKPLGLPDIMHIVEFTDITNAQGFEVFGQSPTFGSRIDDMVDTSALHQADELTPEEDVDDNRSENSDEMLLDV